MVENSLVSLCEFFHDRSAPIDRLFFDFLKVLLTTTESDSDDNVNRHDSDSREEFDRINDVFSPDIGDRSSLVKAGL